MCAQQVCAGSVKLYISVQLCTQKCSSSVQVEYSSTLYLYVNLYVLSAMSVCVLFIWVKQGRGPFRCPERKFGNFSSTYCQSQTQATWMFLWILFSWIFFPQFLPLIMIKTSCIQKTAPTGLSVSEVQALGGAGSGVSLIGQANACQRINLGWPHHN